MHALINTHFVTASNRDHDHGLLLVAHRLELCSALAASNELKRIDSGGHCATIADLPHIGSVCGRIAKIALD